MAETAHAGCSPVDAVLLDAHGTLIALDRPAERLRALLDASGHAHPPDRVAAALRAEILHYRAHLHEARDATSLAALRRECATVLAAALDGDAPPPPELVGILLDALRFVPMPDALPALVDLASLGVPVAVVSNWDCGLPDVLRGLGMARYVASVSASAAVGAAKPDPAIFHHALGRLGVASGRALHCGDQPATDCAGARAAGVRAVLIDRAGALPEGPCPRVPDLGSLVQRVKACNRSLGSHGE